MQKEQKNILIIFVLVFVTFFLAITMLPQRHVAVKNKKQEPRQQMNIKSEVMEPVEEKKGETINVEPEEVVILDTDTNNWQTYRNEEYGFEMKYPNTWKMGNSGSNYFNIYMDGYNNNYKYLRGVIFQNPKKESIEEFYNNTEINKKIKGNEGLMDVYKTTDNTKSIFVDGIEGINFISPIGIAENTVLVIPKDNYMVEIIIRGPEEIEKDSLYELVLSTFKFLK